MEKTLVLIKPDAVERNFVGKILALYEENGLKITELKMLNATEELAKTHYAEHVEKPFFPEILAYITRSPIVALILEGEDAIAKVRAINGSTDPKEAAEGTVRNLYAVSKSENSVHASDSVESAEREIKIWF
ncbi:nucleoside-diphosphate kinase [Clostridium cylindrosporum]|uniref:Nucleoside diphosphate kinase n=1 Tax=Clostridium cylindrosporum DSM 605 TaxID=1121307 RepID=A0A0J8D5I1_CLOCY|nr:nucleoside-diphosphate kinase [Clostridium cylindrosporum]KMT21082.1 nucleoside diphosphate kinase Ndk [Clostridium cylindrosporum DSM 605]